MNVIPAVDIKGGRCVRLLKGKKDQETQYGEDPVEMAKHWEQQGARRLHVVDLDGAFESNSENKTIIMDLLRELTIPCQIGGGLRNSDTVESVLRAGADAAIIGTAGIHDPEWLGKLADDFGADNIIAGVDCKQGQVMVEGWEEQSVYDRLEWAEMLEELGIRRIIYTDVSKDGTQDGPDYEGTRELLEETTLEVVASGGVGSLEHLRNFLDFYSPRLSGVIVGRALYEQSFTFEQAREALSEAAPSADRGNG